MLDLEELLVSDNAGSGSFQPVNAYGQAIPGARAAASAATKPEPVSEPSDESLARRIARLAKAAGRDARGTSSPALYDVHSGLQAFCRGAGIDPEKLPADAQTRMLHLTGQLLREALVGLKDLERSRGELRDRFRIELPPPEPDDPRPSLVRLTVDELLLDILVQHESRSIDAVQWLREAVGEAKSHEQAAAQAMRAAFVEFLDGSIRRSSKPASSGPLAAARPSRPTRLSTGSCSRPSTAISSRCRRTTCRIPSSKRSPRRIAKPSKRSPSGGLHPFRRGSASLLMSLNHLCWRNECTSIPLSRRPSPRRSGSS